MLSIDRLRLLVVPSQRALPWRWDLAQLQIGCCDSWPRPGAVAWASRAKQLAEYFCNERGHVALAFEGYALAGAMWTQGESEAVAYFGPYLMPQYRVPFVADWLSRAIRSQE